MKIAYCFFGAVGGIEGKSLEKKSGSDIVIKMASDRMFKKVDCNQFDFFIHTWNVDRKDQFESIYHPKKATYEEQIIFKWPPHLLTSRYGDRIQSGYSRWYSAKQVIKLKRQYEEENRFKYDLVICCRFDIYWLKSFDFQALDNTKIHMAKCESAGKIYGSPNGLEVQDILFASNSDYIDQFHTLYDFLDEYTKPDQCPTWHSISNHFLAPWHLKKLNLWDKINFPINFWYPDYTNNIVDAEVTVVRGLFPECYRLTNRDVDYDLVKKIAEL